MKHNIGEILGSGFHGDVYELLDHPKQVVKIAWAPLDVPQEFAGRSDTVGLHHTFPYIQNIYQYLLKNQFSILAKVFDFYPLHQRDNKQYYMAILERLQSLTEPEQKAMKSVCMDYNGNIENGKCLQHIEELKEWLDFNPSKVIDFYTSLTTLPVAQRDFHRRNIMKNEGGDFKLIDFELLDFKEKTICTH